MCDPVSGKRIVVGITGASGVVYARRLLQCLQEAGAVLHLVISPPGQRVLAAELGLNDVSVSALLGGARENICVHSHDDLEAAIASGSFRTDGMVICPCSVNTLGAIASGRGDNLLTRAAAVTLKEARRLVLVLREMPLGQIDLENALRCSRAGAIVCPACPGFYLMPKSVDALVDFVVGRVLDLIGVPHELAVRWAGSHGQPESNA